MDVIPRGLKGGESVDSVDDAPPPPPPAVEDMLVVVMVSD